jgi:hypothetical protein
MGDYKKSVIHSIGWMEQPIRNNCTIYLLMRIKE